MENSLKKAVFYTQIIFTGLFLVSFIGSFFLVDKIKQESREMVTEKVANGIASKIDFVEGLLNSKKAKMLLANHQIEVINLEISAFRENPIKYISQMILSKSDVGIPPELQNEKSLKNRLIEKVFSWKLNIKKYFNKTFDALVFDIRLFLFSNVIGMLGAAIINRKNDVIGKYAFAGSLILTGVIFVSAYSYVNTNWLFNILLNSYAGVAYPVGILATTSWLFWEYYKTRKHKENKV